MLNELIQIFPDGEWKEISDKTQKQRIEEIMINNIFKKEPKLSSNLNDDAIDNYLNKLSLDKKKQNKQSINKYEKLKKTVSINRSTNLGEELQNYSGMFEKDCLELFKTNIKAALIKIKNTEKPKPKPTGYNKIHEALKLTDGGADLKELLKKIGVDTTQAGKIIDTIQNISVIELPTEQLTVLLIIICRANGFIELTIRKLADFINLFDETPAANKDRAKNIFIKLFSFCINDNPSDYSNSKNLFSKISKQKEVPKEITIPEPIKNIIIDLMKCSRFTCYTQSKMPGNINVMYESLLPNNILFDSSLKELIKNNPFIQNILNSSGGSSVEDIKDKWCNACQNKVTERSSRSATRKSSRSATRKININSLVQHQENQKKLINYFICIIIFDKIKDNESIKSEILKLATEFWEEISPPINFTEPYISTLAPAISPVPAVSPAQAISPVPAVSPAPAISPVPAVIPAPAVSVAPQSPSKQLLAIRPRQQQLIAEDQPMAQAPSMFGGAFQNYKFWKKECGTCWICKQPIELLILTKSDNPNTITDENKLLPIVTNCGEDEHVICMIPGQCCGTLQATPYILDQTCSTKNIQFQKLLEAGLLPSHVLCNQLKSKKLKIKVSKGLILGKSRLTYQLASSTINDFIKEYDEEKLEGKGGETGKHNKLIQYRAIEDYCNDFDPKYYNKTECNRKKEDIRTNVETHINTIVDLLNDIDDNEASSTIIQIRFLLRGCFLLINTGLLSNTESYKGKYDRKPRWQSEYYNASFGSDILNGIIFGNIFDTNIKGGVYGGSGITNESSVNNIDDLETFIDKFNEDVGIEIGSDLINLFNAFNVDVEPSIAVEPSINNKLQKLYLNKILDKAYSALGKDKMLLSAASWPNVTIETDKISKQIEPTSKVTSSINNPSDQLLTKIFDGSRPDIIMGESSINQEDTIKVGESSDKTPQDPDVEMKELSNQPTEKPDITMTEVARPQIPKKIAQAPVITPRRDKKRSHPELSPNNNIIRNTTQLKRIYHPDFTMKEKPSSRASKKQKIATSSNYNNQTAKAGGKRKTRNKKKKRFTSKKRKKTTIKKNRKIRRKKTIKRRIKV